MRYRPLIRKNLLPHSIGVSIGTKLAPFSKRQQFLVANNEICVGGSQSAPIMTPPRQAIVNCFQSATDDCCSSVTPVPIHSHKQRGTSPSARLAEDHGAQSGFSRMKVDKFTVTLSAEALATTRAARNVDVWIARKVVRSARRSRGRTVRARRVRANVFPIRFSYPISHRTTHYRVGNGGIRWMTINQKRPILRTKPNDTIQANVSGNGLGNRCVS